MRDKRTGLRLKFEWWGHTKHDHKFTMHFEPCIFYFWHSEARNGVRMSESLQISFFGEVTSIKKCVYNLAQKSGNGCWLKVGMLFFASPDILYTCHWLVIPAMTPASLVILIMIQNRVHSVIVNTTPRYGFQLFYEICDKYDIYWYNYLIEQFYTAHILHVHVWVIHCEYSFFYKQVFT